MPPGSPTKIVTPQDPFMPWRPGPRAGAVPHHADGLADMAEWLMGAWDSMRVQARNLKSDEAVPVIDKALK